MEVQLKSVRSDCTLLNSFAGIKLGLGDWETHLSSSGNICGLSQARLDYKELHLTAQRVSLSKLRKRK